MRSIPVLVDPKDSMWASSLAREQGCSIFPFDNLLPCWA
jgi:hypothetical protein